MEIAALSARQPRNRNGRYQTAPFPNWQQAALRTTYCEMVKAASTTVVPLQTRLERSVSSNSTNRQRTRYSSHGLHEYKGKFNPQVVRAIGNIIGLNAGSTVLDPFCGSGTVLVEALHNGWTADGFDINPLAVEIANAKIDALAASPSQLLSAYRTLCDSLAHWRSLGVDGDALTTKERAALSKRAALLEDLPNRQYLLKWFAADILLQIHAVLASIAQIQNSALRRIFRIILSDQLRAVSHQDDGDLRIRRRKVPLQNADVIARFLNAASARISDITSASDIIGVSRRAAAASIADVREPLRNCRSRFDAVITSPPYAMALPYIDTQRLSLGMLGLLESSSLSRVEETLIGSREISAATRRRIEDEMHSRNVALPASATRLCRRLFRSLADSDGFRKQNLPALLYRYLAGMRSFLVEVSSNLSLGAHVAMVVGCNETTIGGVRRTINTPELLADIAQSVGYAVADVMPLDAYQRFGVHAANSIREESLVLLRA
jgi:site-specific DNA-methyltransferase (cytosine-N4-specific)